MVGMPMVIHPYWGTVDGMNEAIIARPSWVALAISEASLAMVQIS